MSQGNVVSLHTTSQEELVAVIERSLERAKAGQIHAIIQVEVGHDILGGPVQCRLSHCLDAPLRDGTSYLALLGSLEFAKAICIESLEAGPG